MISVMVSKWVADAFGVDGIYSVWIALRQYPWLPPRDFRDRGETAAHVMRPADRLVVLHEGASVGELKETGDGNECRAFPVVRGEEFLGLGGRDKLREGMGAYGAGYMRILVLRRANKFWWAVDALVAENPDLERCCTFMPSSLSRPRGSNNGGGSEGTVNLSELLEEAVLQLRKDVPLELVVEMFQKMVRALTSYERYMQLWWWY